MQQYQLAHALGSLLSPEKGSVIFGCHAGNTEKGLVAHKKIAGKESTFFHSPSSWEELWCETSLADPRGGMARWGEDTLERPVFLFGEVRVETSLKFASSGSGMQGYYMDWSVTRL